MQSFKINCIVLSTILLWASAFVGIRVALLDYSPGPLALLRFLVASLCMAVIYHRQPTKKHIPWRDRIQLLIAGILGIGVYNICLNYGEITVSAGIASFIIGLMPAITVLLSVFFLKERLQGAVWVGIFISMMGLLILAVGEGAHADLRTGLICILISALMGAILTILQKQFLKTYSPITIMSWVMWGGTLLLLIFTPQLAREIPVADVHSTAAVIYMGIFPAALAYLAWAYVLKNMSASKASITLYALPLASTLLGFMLLHEQPSLLSLVGGGIALIGALFANHFQSNLLSINKKVVAV